MKTETPINDALELAELLCPHWPAISARIERSGVPTAHVAEAPLKEKLRAIEAELSAAREEKVVLERERDKARAEFAKSPDADPSNPVFRRAQKAAEDLADSNKRVEDLTTVQVATLKMLGGGSPARAGRDQNGPRSGDYPAGTGWERGARELHLPSGRDRVDMLADELLRPAFAGVTVTPSSSLKGPSFFVEPIVEKAADRRFLYPFLRREVVDPGILSLTEFRQTGSRTVTGTVERDPVATTAKANLGLSIELATPSLRQLACLVEGVPAKLFDSEPALLDFLTNELSYQLDVAMDAHVLAQIAAATPAKGETGTGLIVKVRNAVSAARAQGVNPTLLVVSPKVAAELDTWSDKQEEFTFLTRAAGTASPLFGLQIVELPSEEVKPTVIDPTVLGILYTGAGTMLLNPYSGMGKNEVSVRLEWDALYHVRDVSGVYEIGK